MVLTAGHVQTGGAWTFAEAFHWSVWAALFGTALAVGLLVAVVESLTYGSKSNRKGARLSTLVQCTQKTAAQFRVCLRAGQV
jgi:hypothetical protein